MVLQLHQGFEMQDNPLTNNGEVASDIELQCFVGLLVEIT
jgi:hypothetical protein